jgi:anti-sigma regulatory factor (Ser/Thr protein kinase)
MDLCLEEVVSNIIRHGYGCATNHTIRVIYGNPRSDTFTLVVEDEAPPFNPLLFEDKSLTRSFEGSEGGQGIHLLRQFSHAVEYELTPHGNRLTISFGVTEFTRAAR